MSEGHEQSPPIEQPSDEQRWKEIVRDLYKPESLQSIHTQLVREREWYQPAVRDLLTDSSSTVIASALGELQKELDNNPLPKSELPRSLAVEKSEVLLHYKLPSIKTLSTTQIDKENAFLKVMRRKDLPFYLRTTALQTPITTTDGQAGIMMVDLSTAGYVECSDLLERLNPYDPLNRLDVLSLLRMYAEWADKVEDLGFIPADSHPKTNPVITFDEDGRPHMRSYDYGMFHRHTPGNQRMQAYKDWRAPEGTSVGRISPIFSSLVDIVDGFKRYTPSEAAPDSVLSQLQFYTQMSTAVLSTDAPYYKVGRVLSSCITNLQDAETNTPDDQLMHIRKRLVDRPAALISHLLRPLEDDMAKDSAVLRGRFYTPCLPQLTTFSKEFYRDPAFIRKFLTGDIASRKDPYFDQILQTNAAICCLPLKDYQTLIRTVPDEVLLHEWERLVLPLLPE